jgi:hypothetical protein
MPSSKKSNGVAQNPRHQSFNPHHGPGVIDFDPRGSLVHDIVWPTFLYVNAKTKSSCFMEIKKEGEALTPEQEHAHAILRRGGMRVVVVDRIPSGGIKPRNTSGSEASAKIETAAAQIQAKAGGPQCQNP